MNPNNLQVFSDSENYQPSLASHYNPQDNDMLTVSPLGQETESFRSNENGDNVTYATIIIRFIQLFFSIGHQIMFITIMLIVRKFLMILSKFIK